MALIKCTKCGQMVSDKASQCPHCGNPIVKPNEVVVQKDDVSANKQNVETKPAKKRNKGIVAIICVLVIVLVGLGSYYFFMPTSEPTVVITEQLANKIRKYEKLSSFHEGLAAVQRNGLWGYIDTEGNEVIPCIYKGTEYGNYAFPFSEDMAVIIDKDGKYGYINKKGEMIVKPQFEEAGNFSEGVASVFSDGKLNFIGKDGKYIGELSNKFIWDYNLDRNLPQFKNGVCKVHIPAKEPSEGIIADIIYINKKGNEVEQPVDESPKELYVKYWEDDKVGYKDTIGNIIVPAKYSSLGKFSCGVAVATLEYGERGHGMEEWYSDDYIGLYGYVDLKGNETFTWQDHDKIKAAAMNAEMEKNQEKLRREKQEAEQRQMESVKSWIQGNWKCNTPYGELRLGISGDYITVFSNGRPDYTGTYTIEDNHIVYDRHDGYSSYVIIDAANQRLMADENTPMQRFEGSSSGSYSMNRSTSRKTTFRTSSDVMSYVVGKTFYGSRNNVRIKIDWDGVYLNGRRQYSGAPQVVSFSADKAIIRVSIIPSGTMNFLVQPQEGNIVDMNDGYPYYAK